jgi:hypothetical protein
MRTIYSFSAKFKEKHLRIVLSKKSLHWNMYLVLQQKLFPDLVKQTNETQPNNNNATVMAKAMNGDGNSESRGWSRGARRRQPQRWCPKEQRQWWWWRWWKLGGGVAAGAAAAEVAVVVAVVVAAGEVAGDAAAAEAVMAAVSAKAISSISLV